MESEYEERAVRFRVRDIYLPDPQEILFELYGDEELEGHVVSVSDSGEPKGTYAVIEVTGVDEPIIVPRNRLRAEKDRVNGANKRL